MKPEGDFCLLQYAWRARPCRLARPRTAQVQVLGYSHAAYTTSSAEGGNNRCCDTRKGAVDSKGKTLKKHINATPMVLQEQGMSLWNVALEIHVGRFFISFIPELSSAFYVYCTGIIILLVLVSGLLLHPKLIRKRKN